MLVCALEIRYLDPSVGAEWVAEWPSRLRIPVAVRIRMLGDAGQALPGALAVPLTVPLARDAGR